MAIDKQTAGILYGYNYKLKDSEGNVYDIDTPIGYGFDTYFNGLIKTYIKWEEIGTTYKILARDLEQLTQEIEHDGETFIPVVKMGMDKIQPEGYVDRFMSDAIRTPKLVKHFLVQQLHEWHFNIGFPDNTTTNLI